MSQVLLLFSLRVELLKAAAVELSVLTLIVSWMCPKASSILIMPIAILVLWNNPPVSASAADETTCFSNAHSMWTGAL